MRVPAVAAFLSFRYVGSAIPLTDPENDELRRLDRRNPDDADQLAIVDVGLSHRGAVAAYEERFFLFCALEHPVAPQPEEEIADAAPHASPERLVIDPEHDPLRRSLN